MKTLRGNSDWWALFWLAAIIIVGAIWFNNAHPSTHFNGLEDYRDTWFTDTRNVRALYCGKSPNIYCNTDGDWFVARATWDGKENAASSETKWIHYFTINFQNGGWLETEATCDKAAEGWYFYKRFCRAYARDTYGDEMLFLIVPYD